MITSKFLKTLLLLSSFFSLSYCMEEDGEPQWLNEFEFHLTCRHGETGEIFPNVLFTCQDKIPRRYSLPNASGFPQLNLHSTQSCESYFPEVSQYVARLKILRREYIYSVLLNGQHLALLKMPPDQLPLPCTLSGLRLTPNYNLRKLELSWCNLRLGEEDSGVVFDATDKIKHRMGDIPLPPPKIEGESSLEQIVSTRPDFNDRVYDALGAVNTFKVPAISGVSGCEEPQEERFVLYTKGSTLYENALASKILPSPSKKRLITVLDLEGEAGDLSHISSSFSSLSSFADSFAEEDFDEKNLALHRYFKLVGHERRATSPYLYNDGKSLFLTQTFEQDCVAYDSGKEEESGRWIVRYTRQTSYPVQAIDFSPAARERGIYQGEGGAWMLLNGFYDAQDFFPASLLNHRGALTEMIFSQPETYELKTTLGLIGLLGEYVELTGQERFAELVDQFKDSTRGIVRTIVNLPEDEDHLMGPLLLSIRQREDLDEPELLDNTPSDKQFINQNKRAWGLASSSPLGIEYFPLKKKLTQGQSFYVYKLPFLKLLPLIMVRSQLSPDDKLTLLMGDCEVLKKGGKTTYRPLYFEEGKKLHEYLAYYLELDEAKNFGLIFYPPNYESDRELSIEPLARCLRHLKNLETFSIPNYLGVKNLEHLIDRGLSQNKS